MYFGKGYQIFRGAELNYGNSPSVPSVLSSPWLSWGGGRGRRGARRPPR